MHRRVFIIYENPVDCRLYWICKPRERPFETLHSREISYTLPYYLATSSLEMSKPWGDLPF